MGTFLSTQSMVLIVVGGLLFYGMFVWTTDYFENAQESSNEQRQVMAKCSELQVEFIDRETTNESTTVFFTVNRPLEAVMIGFIGFENRTQVIRDVEKNTVYSASADITNVSRIGATAQECSELLN